jgi:hypothetical protein
LLHQQYFALEGHSNAIEGDLAMKISVCGVAMAGLFLLGAAAPTFAHHGFGVEFDGSKCMDLKGTLSGVIWENPHAYFQMDVKDASGKTVVWHLEMITPNALKRNGTTRQDFLANMGKMMNTRACPAKANGGDATGGDSRGAAEYIKLADGVLRIVGQLPERGITPDKLNF